MARSRASSTETGCAVPDVKSSSARWIGSMGVVGIANHTQKGPWSVSAVLPHHPLILLDFPPMPEPVYLDHAATTPVRAEVLEAMQPYFGPRFGNPSSVHRWGREARAALDEARERLGRCLGAASDEVVFTSCGTEADNMALLGVWRARRADGRPGVVTTPIEHKA